MVKKCIGSLLLIASFVTNAQVTHSICYSAGVTNVLYKSMITGSKSYPSFLLPTTTIEYTKHNDNTFWGGAGVGFAPRRIPYHTYSQQQKIGADLLEFWFRVRAGLTFEGEHTTLLPYLSLGIASYIYNGTYSKNGISSISYSNYIDTTFNTQSLLPFFEVGSKFLNKSFREDKANFSMTFALRYYPAPIFKSPVRFEYDYLQYKTIQYHLIELSMVIGFQFNVHR